MSKTIRSHVVLAVVVSLAGTVGFAQSPGDAIYKAKCQSCHGATGLADTTMGKALKMKPITDSEVMNFGEGRMIDATTNGIGKMQPFKGKLTDAEIKDAVAYFRTFIKR